MKLEARLHTSDILADIDDALFAVSNLSAKIAFENLFPTCEIGEEIAERYVETGSIWPSFNLEEVLIRWNSIGRQRDSSQHTCSNLDCDCSRLPDKLDVEGICQPFFLDDDELFEYQRDELEIPKNDYDAMLYSLGFFGDDIAYFEIGYGGVKPLTFDEIHEEYQENDDW